jgi:hypothetical protein
MVTAMLADEGAVGVVEMEVPRQLIGRRIANEAGISARLLIG